MSLLCTACHHVNCMLYRRKPLCAMCKNPLVAQQCDHHQSMTLHTLHAIQEEATSPHMQQLKGVGAVIRDCFRNAGLNVHWSGEADDSIVIKVEHSTLFLLCCLIQVILSEAACSAIAIILVFFICIRIPDSSLLSCCVFASCIG